MPLIDNYKLIARNIISYFIKLADLYGSKFNFKQLLFLAGIADTSYYLSRGKFTDYSIALAVDLSQSGFLSLENCRRNLDISDNITPEKHLIYFVMQLECLIFQADNGYTPDFILDCVIENKHRILEGMNDAFNRSNSILLDSGIEKIVRSIVSVQNEKGYLLGMWDNGRNFEQEAQTIMSRYRNSQTCNYSQRSYSSTHYSKLENESTTTINNSKGSSLFAIVFGILSCLALFFVLIYPEIDWGGKAAAAYKAAPTPEADVYTSVNPISFPSNGQSYVHNGREREAPFIIHLPDDSDYYYIVLADNTTGRRAVSIYGHSGETLEVQVPLGEYSLFYCCGDEWYGNDAKFGDDGLYFKTSGTLDFYNSGDYVYYHEVTLYPTYNGNMNSIDVEAADFPM